MSTQTGQCLSEEPVSGKRCTLAFNHGVHRNGANAWATDHDAEIERLTEERDLAIAHDRQPYPTAWAYEQVVKALEAQHQRAGQAERTIARVRQMADAWERRLPAMILTATAVEALRTATERYAIAQPGDEPAHEADPQAVDPQWLDRLHTVQSREPDDQPKEPT